eukprot:TRINITY_DN30369_c0_g2_i1.p1 TRINITY_DN30369_c0_g2~~TRINITY_DN30369_c0_g2_i1.p1  ORF type:complete len:675 (+),score=94.62 TRINITY_DN30369_c0_g2_i1:107-2131(+)
MPISLPPTREPPRHHKCDACPGGASSNTRELHERDAILRCFVDSCLAPDRHELEASKMTSITEWKSFLFKLEERDLLGKEALDLLASKEPPPLSAGFDAWAFQRWLVENVPCKDENGYYGGQLLNLDRAVEAMRSAIHGVNAHVSFRGLDSLTQRELYTYQVLLSEYEHGVVECLRRVNHRVRSSDECVKPVLGAGLVEEMALNAERRAKSSTSKAEPAPPAQTPEEFQWARGPEIERRLREIRVPAVSLREQNVLGRTSWGMRRLLGHTVQDHKEILVLEVPWDLQVQDNREAALGLTDFCNHIDALKQLTLSRYFLDYLGSDFSSYTGLGLHFLPLKHGYCLRDVIATAGPLHEKHILFRYWAREILLALRDYLYQCCQELTQDITLEHVYVHQEGLQLLLQGVHFGERRGQLSEEIPEYGLQPKWRNSYLAVENRLISMFGHMLVELLHGIQLPGAIVPTLQELSPSLRCLIYEAINARDTLDYFRGMAPCTHVDEVHGISSLPPASSDDAELQAWDPRRALNGGFAAAGLESETGEGCDLYWMREAEGPEILPNLEGSVDRVAGGEDLRENWLGEDQWGLDIPHEESPQGDERKKTKPWATGTVRGDLRWEPNLGLFTLQELLDHAALSDAPPRHEPAILDAWDACRIACDRRRREEGVRSGRPADRDPL